MRQSFTVFAAVLAASLVATPLVISASNAFATPESTDAVVMPAVVTAIEVAPVAAPAVAETCQRKVRVVYAGYAQAGCTAAR
ncbi:hypothetical protein ASG40_05855 [Methylobacterium sp. Leaf399]|uniref:hypothetical protein n=1 Tax=Methylobacterium sp. Leaf399 TaxID=1736364 RepID=UPI0006FC4E57|nr:hypothetical protein [Methylobacterium sp. Leaf399]KQT14827.1 hypothetical protein ASG40_05855 [Methylobacterium sp. Leaf399]